jgi:hypothetical protein
VGENDGQRDVHGRDALTTPGTSAGGARIDAHLSPGTAVEFENARSTCW